MKTFTLLLSGLFTSSFFAAASLQAQECKKEQAKAIVEKACGLANSEANEAAAKSAVQKLRYCGSNYVWLQDEAVKMVMHPIKPRLNGKDLKDNKDEKGKKLFVEFDKMANANADGGWVEYYWAKPGAEKATPKVSFVKKCGKYGWIAGSGIWTN